ncbi:MAG: hypothetical protein GWO24_31640, partial [Akkermansiaceae bacterium]|nr:hypothetical protein [Akkermansiaceae bacterium]
MVLVLEVIEGEQAFLPSGQLPSMVASNLVGGASRAPNPDLVDLSVEVLFILLDGPGIGSPEE